MISEWWLSINWGKRAQNEIATLPIHSAYLLAKMNMQIERLCVWNVGSLNSNLILDWNSIHGVHFTRSVCYVIILLLRVPNTLFLSTLTFFLHRNSKPKIYLFVVLAIPYCTHNDCIFIQTRSGSFLSISLSLSLALSVYSLFIATCTNCQSQCNLILQS